MDDVVKSIGKGDTNEPRTGQIPIVIEKNPFNDSTDEVTDPNQFTGEDILRMKNLSVTHKSAQDSSAVSDVADQSVQSVADSTSNFTDRLLESVGESDNEVLSENKETFTSDQPTEEKSTNFEIEQKHYYGGFMFGRERSAKPEIPQDTVTVLNYPFAATAIPPGDNEKEFQEALADSKVYLVGTAHFSPNSQEDVLKTIQNTQPDMVMVELCPSRISILSMDEETLLQEAKNINFEKILSTIRQCGAVQGVLHVLLLSMSAYMTRELGMAPGGEFRAAHKGAMKVNMCRVILGDRPIHVTLQRALGSLGLWQKARLLYHIVLSHNASITQEEVERCKRSDLLEELLKELAGEFPSLSKIFVEERDLYMISVLHTLLKKATYDKRLAWNKTDAKWQSVSVVAVVGIGHVPGIVANWKKSIDVTDLMLPIQPTRIERAFRLAMRAVFYGVAAFTVYRIGSKVVAHAKLHMK